MRWAGTIAFFAAVAGANIFLILYTMLARWWKTSMGRHLFSFMGAIALALNYIVVQLIWPGLPYRAHARVVLYGAIAIVIWWRIIILISVQVRGNRDGSLRGHHPQEGAWGSNGSLDVAPHPNPVVVEGKHLMGSDDERLGERGRTLRGLPGGEGRGFKRGPHHRA